MICLVLFIGATYWIAFCGGLSRFYVQNETPAWRSYLPIFNFVFLVKLVGLPRRLFWLSLVPYIGKVYAIAAMQRLAKTYGKDLIFTSVWLALGATIGAHRLTHDPSHLDA